MFEILGEDATARPEVPQVLVPSPIPDQCTCMPQGDPVDNACGLVLANEMEVLSLSLSRFQGLCHSLSKVLFKLSLTLLVRYRSFYSVFNFGRHIPAT
jgi:hypothetical protein